MLCALVACMCFGEENQCIVNSRNQNILIAGSIRKIAALPSDALEVIRILDAEDLVVGVNSNVLEKPEYWPRLKNCSQIGRPFEPGYEQIISLWPDVVIAYGGLRPGPELENKLLPLGITVLRMNFYKESALIREITDFGQLIGREKEAAAFAAWHEACVDLVREGLKQGKKPPKVFLEGYGDYRVSGPGTGGFEMGVMAGGNMICAEYPIPNPVVSTEYLASHDPDVIVKMVSGLNSYKDTTDDMLREKRRDIMNRPGWSYLNAVKTGQVYAISSDIGPGPRGIIAVLYMATFFYPDAFKDLDVRKFHKEYMERFQRVPFKGIYAYPAAASINKRFEHMKKEDTIK